ncbi:MAG: Tex family protein, partial [Chitinivibrionales bacterium]|nr:Tex family protein [Chitinivibrionales bacterium]
MDIIKQLIAELNLSPSGIGNAIALFNEGATIPFIARYRKESTGSLDEIQLRDILHKYTYYKELDERRAAILESIGDKLTPELRAKIESVLNKTELEDLYLPFKPKRTTRASKAREAGLEPLARWLLECDSASADPAAEAQKYLNPEKGIDSPEKALQGAADILAEEFAEDADAKKWLRSLALEQGIIVSVVRKEFKDQTTKFNMYYDFKEKVCTLPSHRILAMLRGEHEKYLRLALEFPQEAAYNFLETRFVKHKSSATFALVCAAVKDALDRQLSLALETEIRIYLREKAEAEAFVVFGENLRALLLAPPAGQKTVMGIDPGFRTGCKVAVLNDKGAFLEYHTIFPHEPHNKKEAAEETIRGLINKHGVRLIAIGNGTAGRETDLFIKSLLGQIPEALRPVCVMVSEAGASVYSASDVAIAEFPEMDLTVRGAISIARRLQDPLSELVKIDPKAIGVGQYQHDVNQGKLMALLEETVESCVNQVGVNVNLASQELLKYVSGLNRMVAANIVKFRNDKGAFSAREDLKKVSGLGPKMFEQAAGFLRIPEAINPLDNSSVHPERYEFVRSVARALHATVEQLIGNTPVIKSINKNSFVSE